MRRRERKMKELSEVEIESLWKKLRFKRVGARVCQYKDSYLVFYSSVFYNDQGELTRKEIHCFYYDDIQLPCFTFLPLIKIINEEEITKLNNLMSEVELSPERSKEEETELFSPETSEDENGSSSSDTEMQVEDEEEDEELNLVLQAIEKKLDKEEEKLDRVLEEIESEFEIIETLGIERKLNDPRHFDIEKESREILLLEKQGYPSDSAGYKVGFFQYQIQQYVVREARCLDGEKCALKFFVVDKDGETSVYGKGEHTSHKRLDDFLVERGYYEGFLDDDHETFDSNWPEDENVEHERVVSISNL